MHSIPLAKYNETQYAVCVERVCVHVESDSSSSVMYAKTMTNYIWIQCDSVVDDNAVEHDNEKEIESAHNFPSNTKASEHKSTLRAHRQVIMFMFAWFTIFR